MGGLVRTKHAYTYIHDICIHPAPDILNRSSIHAIGVKEKLRANWTIFIYFFLYML